MPSMSSSDEARRRLRTLSREQLRGRLPRGKALAGSSRSVSREHRLVDDWAAGDGGSRSRSIRASVSDCMQLSLDGIRNSFRGTSSLFGCPTRGNSKRALGNRSVRFSRDAKRDVSEKNEFAKQHAADPEFKGFFPPFFQFCRFIYANAPNGST